MIFKELKLGYLVSILVAGVLLTGCGSEAYIDKGDPAYIEVVEDILGNANGVPASAEQINSLDGVSGAVDGIDYSEILQQGEYVDRTHPTYEEIQEAINSAVPALRDFAGTINEDLLVGTVVGNINIVRSGVSAITAFTLSDSSTFAIDANGQITTKVALDYETTTSYALTATATNSAGESVAVNVNISVSDVADVVPTLLEFTGSVAEDVTVGTVVGSIIITSSGDSTITAITLSGTGNDNFEVATNGAITIKVGASLDYETTTSYALTAMASNSAGESAAVNVNISVSNVVDNAPVLTVPSGVSMPEESAVGTSVTTITLNGNNNDENTITSFSIKSGDANGDFSIDTNGEVTTAKTLDYAIASSYTLGITASNAAGESAPIELNITVIKTNTAPTASDFNMTLGTNKSIVMADWNVSSSATDIDDDMLTATVKTQGSYGTFVVIGNTLTYSKTTESNITDTGVLEISDGRDVVEITVKVRFSYWKHISVGRLHTVAIKSDGTLWAWGYNNAGQLGDGTTISKSVPTQESTGATNWSSVSAGDNNHTIAIKSDGTLWAWGYNNAGQLGDGTTISKSVPTQESTGATDWSSVSAGGYHTVAIKGDGTLWTWGLNTQGQLGDGSPLDKSIPAQENTGAADWSSVSAGGNHTVAIKSDGTLWAWGYNSSGQLGDGTIIHKNVPTQEGTGATDWSSVSTGQAHTVAIKSDGTLWAWGYNMFGQLGDGSTINSPVPLQESTNAADWSSMSAGGYHAVAIKSDGTLWSWGLNTSGQLGDGTAIDSSVPIQESTSVTDWSFVGAGGHHSIAVKSDDSLWAWGANWDGQLGDGTTMNSYVPIEVIAAP